MTRSKPVNNKARKTHFDQAHRWVVKVGSALLTDNGGGLNQEQIESLVKQMIKIREGIRPGLPDGKRQLVLVSSGAVAAGMDVLGWKERPNALHKLQAAAAAGQMRLVQCYETAFREHTLHAPPHTAQEQPDETALQENRRTPLHTAQVLLGHDDIDARDRYLNARGTLETLLKLGVVPVVNENDAVVTDEIRFGDNDTLAAMVANLIDADTLVILTDQDGLHTADPRSDPKAKLVPAMDADAPELEGMAGGSGKLGRGGMLTKVRAARLAARSGTDTFIANGAVDNVLLKLARGDNIGTWLRAGRAPLAARKQWLAGLVASGGVLELDAGAVRVLSGKGRSLLPVGVKAVRGRFKRGDMVVCHDEAGREVARGLSNYSAAEAAKIIGHRSDEIEALLGYQGEEEIIHRDNLVLR